MSELKGPRLEKWVLKLYVYDDTPAAKNAIENLRHICEVHLKDRCDITVIDLKEHPECAAKKQILAIPTLVKELPLPVRTLIGDLMHTKKVLAGLELEKHG